MNKYFKSGNKRTSYDFDSILANKKIKISDNGEEEESEPNHHNPLEVLIGGNHEKDVTIHDNHIYYRCAVTKHSIMILDKLISKANENYELLESVCKIAYLTPKPIYLHISSDGGDLTYGFMGYDIVTNSKIPIYTVVEGSVCSAATLIAIAGKKRYALENSMVLIHQLTTGAYGKAEELKDNCQNVELFMKKLKRMYLEKTKMKSNNLDKLLIRDLYLDVETCLKYGLVDEIYNIKNINNTKN